MLQGEQVRVDDTCLETMVLYLASTFSMLKTWKINQVQGSFLNAN
jgi:hypothetical protein